MTSQPHESHSVSIVAALRWLIGSGLADDVTERTMRRYYARNGHRSGHASAGRRGAANRMLYRLEEAGLVEDGVVTRKGRRAAQ
jgi:ribosomal protein S19E (S16A)